MPARSAMHCLPASGRMRPRWRARTVWPADTRVEALCEPTGPLPGTPRIRGVIEGAAVLKSSPAGYPEKTVTGVPMVSRL